MRQFVGASDAKIPEDFGALLVFWRLEQSGDNEAKEAFDEMCWMAGRSSSEMREMLGELG